MQRCVNSFGRLDKVHRARCKRCVTPLDKVHRARCAPQRKSLNNAARARRALRTSPRQVLFAVFSKRWPPAREETALGGPGHAEPRLRASMHGRAATRLVGG